MGTWNATCGITQLPITEGQRVALIPLIVKQHDFLSRDSLAGGGSCNNDLIAQPFSLPLFGTYDSVGGIVPDRSQPGKACLLKVFEKLVQGKGLMRTPSAKPVPVKKASIALLDEMMRRELIYQTGNPRKEWLKQLHKTYASLSPEEQAGMKHYKPQMEVDVNTLPDTLDLGMGAMLVHEELYLALANKAGEAESFGYWDEKKSKVVSFKGNRRGELESFITVSPEQREKVTKLLGELEAVYTQASKDNPAMTEALVKSLLGDFPLAAVPQAVRISEEFLFLPNGAKHALVEGGYKDNAKARQLWVDFMLFNSAFTSLRKQWTPQAGAGSSAGLGDFHDIYQVQHEFVGKTLGAFYDAQAVYAAEAAAREAARKAAKPRKPRAKKQASPVGSAD